MHTITLKGTEYNIKYTLRAVFIFELITKKHFEISTTFDQYVFFYSLILANNKDCLLSFDLFIDILDEEPEAITKFVQFMTDSSKVENQFKEDTGESEGN